MQINKTTNENKIFKKKTTPQPAKGTHIPGVRPQSWGAAQIPHSSERIPKPMTPAPSSSGSPTKGAGLNQIASPSFLPDSRIVFFTDLAVEEFTYPDHSTRSCIFDVFLVGAGGQANSAPSYSTILISLKGENSYSK